jgi:HD superfamily phosphodiesterase
MEIVYLALDDIIQMTMQVGGDWAAAHAKRLLELVKQISVDVPYDPHVMELAVYMHDWGAFPTYSQKDVEHAVRSRQVVESEILMHLDLTPEQKMILLETIELHDYRDMQPTQSNEALLLREALIEMVREGLN